MSARLIILGSGTSFGVPVVGCTCSVCGSADPRDRRTRAAALVDDGATRVLIDTPPELRLQLIRHGVRQLDAVLYTHEHADHVHGIDDLRAISLRPDGLTLYGPPETLTELRARFRYIFDDAVVPAPGTSKPKLTLQAIQPFAELSVGTLRVMPLELDHGGMRVYGYRIGDVAYITDAKSVSPRVLQALQGTRILVLNALFEQAHATHLSIPEAIAVARAVGAQQTFLTHLTHRFAHAALELRLPTGVCPAHDGLTVDF